MGLRIGAFIVLVMLTIVTNNVITVMIHPTLSADLAVNQLNDEESAAIAIRSYEHALAYFPIVSWGIVCLSGLLLFRTYLTDCVKAALTS